MNIKVRVFSAYAYGCTTAGIYFFSASNVSMEGLVLHSFLMSFVYFLIDKIFETF